jgi:hypothetical protein
MQDETLVEPFAVSEYFVDGFTDYEVHNGILSCAGYRLQKPSRLNGDPLKVVIFRIVCPVSGADDAATKTKTVLAPTNGEWNAKMKLLS